MRVQPILVPYDTARRGWRSGAGPEHLWNAGLGARLRAHGHDLSDPRLIEPDPGLEPAEIATGFDLMRRVSSAVRAARAEGRFPLVLSGNCNISVGTLSGLSPARRAIFWFDAHGDLNTPDTTATGFLDGTGLATALGMGWSRLAAAVPGFEAVRDEDVFLLGARDLDPPEEALLEASAVTPIAAADLPGGLARALAESPLGGALGYVHVDLDVVDPDGVGRANFLPVAGGLSVERLTATIAAIRERVHLGAAALASYAPEYDRDGAVLEAACAVAETVVSEGA